MEGNEQVDAEAKRVVEQGSSLDAELPELLRNGQLLHSLTAADSSFKADLLTHWRTLWEGGVPTAESDGQN